MESAVRDIIIDICEVLYRNGYKSAPIGAIMRLIGVPEERAQVHDGELFDLNNEFMSQLAKRKAMLAAQIPLNTTIH